MELLFDGIVITTIGNKIIVKNDDIITCVNKSGVIVNTGEKIRCAGKIRNNIIKVKLIEVL